jgi:hypothetical protein
MLRRTDMHPRTLRKIIEAMGGELEITARFPDRRHRIDQLAEPRVLEGKLAGDKGARRLRGCGNGTWGPPGLKDSGSAHAGPGQTALDVLRHRGDAPPEQVPAATPPRLPPRED